jgi:hypothetical protein
MNLLILGGFAVTVACLIGVIRALHRLQAQIGEVLAASGGAHTSTHPCFSELEIRKAWTRTQELHSAYRRLESDLYSQPDWKPDNKPFIPSDSIKERMEKVCVALANWNESVLRYEFMIELNLRVIRGEKTIAEARGLYESLPTLSPLFGSWRVVTDQLSDWHRSLAGGAEVTGPQDARDSQDRQREEIAEWQDRRYVWTRWKLI